MALMTSSLLLVAKNFPDKFDMCTFLRAFVYGQAYI